MDAAVFILRQFFLYPIPLISLWWSYLFSKSQIDIGPELLFIRSRHPLLLFGGAFLVIHSLVVVGLGVISAVLLPAAMKAILPLLVTTLVRSLFYSTMFMVINAALRSATVAFVSVLAYAAVAYVLLYGFNGINIEAILPNRAPVGALDALGLVLPTGLFVTVAIVIVWQLEKRYFRP